jgi:serine/threonine-protein kinase
MERLHGETLAQRILRSGPVSPYEAVDIMLQVLSALVAAHERGVVHRDLKPENIFLTQRAGMLPVAKLLDFGISKVVALEDTALSLTQPGMVMGTPYYMAPEQARGDRQIDHRVDLWAAGVILYEALTAQRPFVARNYNALLVQILTVWQRPVTEILPGVSQRLSRIVDRALAKAPEERFQTAGDFLEALRRFKKRAPSRSETPQPAPPPRPMPRIEVHEIVDEASEDGTIVFARVQDSRPIVVTDTSAIGNAPAPARPGAAKARADPPPLDGPPGPPEEEATMVDPPSFLEDSVTMVRRDPRPRRDRG